MKFRKIQNLLSHARQPLHTTSSHYCNYTHYVVVHLMINALKNFDYSFLIIKIPSFLIIKIPMALNNASEKFC